MQAEEPPPQAAPFCRAQGLRKGGGKDQRPALIGGSHATDRHRITKREGAAVGGGGDINPGDLILGREALQIAAQFRGIGQKRDHRHRLPQRKKRQLRPPFRQALSQQTRQGRDAEVNP